MEKSLSFAYWGYRQPALILFRNKASAARRVSLATLVKKQPAYFMETDSVSFSKEETMSRGLSADSDLKLAAKLATELSVVGHQIFAAKKIIDLQLN